MSKAAEKLANSLMNKIADANLPVELAGIVKLHEKNDAKKSYKAEQ